MRDPKSTASTSSGGAAAFLAEWRSHQEALATKRRRLQRYACMLQLDEAVREFKAALPTMRDNEPSSIQSDSVAAAFLKLVAECRRLQASQRVQRLLDEEASIDSDRVAQSLFRAAAADDRPALVHQVNALALEAPEFQTEVWLVVGWRAQLISSNAPPPRAGGEAEPGRQDSPPDEAVDGRPRMTCEEANAKAMKLVEAGILNLEWSQREWAEHIGCSVGLVGKLPLWVGTMKVTGRGGKNRSGRPPIVSLTSDLEGAVGREDHELQRLMAERQADAELSPADPRTAKVYRRNRP